MKKKLLTMAMAGVLSASMIIPAYATQTPPETTPETPLETTSATGTKGEVVPYDTGTKVLAGIVINDLDARIKVEVPSLFAFVVNGTVDEKEGSVGVNSEDGTILLPNVAVAVAAEENEEGNRDYEIQTVGEENLRFTNFSTRASKDGEESVDGRIGLEVTLSGSIENKGTAVSRNNWEHVRNAEELEADESGFKKYTLEVKGKKFNKLSDDGGLMMEEALELPAPNLAETGLDPKSKLAQSGEDIAAEFNVYIGGQRGQYNQVEESAKVGMIVWTVSAAIENTGDVPTSPDNDPL